MAALPIFDRFIRWIEPEANGCWRWLGNKSWGYGYLSAVNGKRVRAHRLSYELFIDSIPSGLQLDHLCRNRACVNPTHLEPVTASVNLTRAIGTETCPKGHVRTWSADGRWKRCLICISEWQKTHHERRLEIQRAWRQRHAS